MKRKEEFLKAVQILAPDDQFILQAAQNVNEDSLPNFPGAAALEFVVALERFRPAAIKTQKFPAPKPPKSLQPLSTSHALRVKSAEYWLELGEPDRAMKELETLPKRAWNHPWTVKTRMAAVRVGSSLSEVAVQE